MEENTNEVNIMIEVRNNMEKIPLDYQTIEYYNIYKSITSYIEKNCQHNLVQDTIDIDLDTSRTICYCNRCFMTFTSY